MLEEVGIDYELVPTSWDGEDNRQPEFLAINPNGKVPALTDGNLVLWESLAINLFLTQRYGGPLAFRTDRDLAVASRWSFWAMGEFEGPIDAVARYDAKLPQGWAAPALTILNGTLEESPWLGGDAFGVADLNVATLFQRPILAKVDRRPFPFLNQWLKNCRTRPAFLRMIEIGRAASYQG